ncbi:MAG: hypothetical protein NT002_13020 [candidate division Zixibacteria bacterium]|nr:hypothetical protein [candidate division Zixibacteria bacterium]
MNDNTDRERSFDKINYLLRPKKQIERKILIDIFNKIDDISDYHYIGLGSVFFYDFILFHKYLNIKRMTSLEKDKKSVKRCKFNRPYDFIKFHSMSTTEFIDNHSFNEKSIIWFDYDTMLWDLRCKGSVRDISESAILQDVRIITKKVNERTFFILTVDVTPPTKVPEWKSFIETFGAYLGDFPMIRDRDIPSQKEDLRAKYNQMIQAIILNSIDDNQRFQRLKFTKLFSFYCKDSSPMYTLGGVYDDPEALNGLISTIKRDNGFVNLNEGEITNIDVPILTYKEKCYLDHRVEELTNAIGNNAENVSLTDVVNGLEFEIIPPHRLRTYLDFYRYYPQYYEGII